MNNVYCFMCGPPFKLDKTKVECIECGDGYCKECAAEHFKGGVCGMCQSKNPVFFDVHSRTVGDVKQGAA